MSTNYLTVCFFWTCAIEPLCSVIMLLNFTFILSQMMLFPGLWVSHGGQVLSVELVAQPSQQLTIAKVQILRPYCSPNLHLVPPGGCELQTEKQIFRREDLILLFKSGFYLLSHHLYIPIYSIYAINESCFN